MLCPVHDWPLKDSGGCWMCYDEKRQQDKLEAKAATPKKLYPISKQSDKKKAREKELATKAKKLKDIPKVSKKQGKVNAELARIKKELLYLTPYCFTTGSAYNLTLSHIIPRTYKQFEVNRMNLVLESFGVHQIWEHDKPQFAELYPNIWQIKLDIVSELCPEFYFKLIDKIKQAS